MRAIAIDPIQLAVARSFGMLNTAVSGPDQVVDTVQLDSAPQSLILQIQASALGAGGSITVEIQTSPDGSTWTDAYSHEFADSGETSATIDGDLYVQATATPSGDTGHATVQVSCTPSIIAVGAAGGGSPAIAVKLAFAYDTPGLLDGLAIPGYTPQAGDVIDLVTQIQVINAWNVASKGDIFIGSGATSGFFATTVGAFDMTELPQAYDGFVINGDQYYRAVVTDDADAAYVAVSQDGTRGYTPAYAAAVTAPSLPLTVVTGTNDEFVFTGNGGEGSPVTYTVAAGVYTTIAEAVTAMAAAVNGVPAAFSLIATPTNNSGSIKLTMAGENGLADNGNTITEGSNDVAAALGFTGASFEGGQGGDPGADEGSAAATLVVWRPS